MSQYVQTPKNPPWARSGAQTMSAQQQSLNLSSSVAATPMAGTTILSPNSSVVHLPQPQVFSSAIGISQSALGLPTSLSSPIGTSPVAIPAQLSNAQVTAVSYPNPRGIQSNQFPALSSLGTSPHQSTLTSQHQSTSSQSSSQHTGVSQQQPQSKNRAFTGSVTKLHDNFGFVDEDTFFQTSCVKGSMPKVGDRVLVEALYNANMPFKWNATRIQLLPNQSPGSSVGGPPSNRGQGPIGNSGTSAGGFGKQVGSSSANYNAVPPPLLGNGRQPRRLSPNVRSSRDRLKDKRREDTPRSREREKERERDRDRLQTTSAHKRSRSPAYTSSRSPLWRKPRVGSRYIVQIPKMSLIHKLANVGEVKRRYNNLYIPSDFFCARFQWMDAFPASDPFPLDSPCAFHITPKGTTADVEVSAVPIDPPDADHAFSAKVMLLSAPEMNELYHQSCSLAEDPVELQESFVHPTRLLQFLVGLGGKNETMAIGGPWSPSLDGKDPAGDPTTLIKTAIRTCRTLSGIDLSNCTRWFRFVEISYRRDRDTDSSTPRVETVVLFIPDVWSCLPTQLEWDERHRKNGKQPTSTGVNSPNKKTPPPEEPSHESTSIVEEEPTVVSDIDPKTLKVNELRHELEARGINSKGLKSQLVARLTKALRSKSEKHDEDEHMEDSETQSAEETLDTVLETLPTKETVASVMETKSSTEGSKSPDEESISMEECQPEETTEVTAEREFTPPPVPHIIVNPSKSAKGGKFNCTLMSLSLLLDYRPEDNKEHSFEVSLFAELFNEMLTRDFGFFIYRTLLEAADIKTAEEKKSREAEKKTENKKDEKEEESSQGKNKVEEKEECEQGGDTEEPSSMKRLRSSSKDDDKKKEKDDDRKKEKDDDKKKEKDKTQMVTTNPALLLACIYFDQSHCGYIVDKDIEEIFFILELNLSRCQIRRIVQKVLGKDSPTYHYRKWTDSPKTDVAIKGNGEPRNKRPKVVPCSQETALGNRCLLPNTEGNGTTKEGTVIYKGSLLDMEKLLLQVTRNEKARRITESHLLQKTKEKDNLQKCFEELDAKDMLLQQQVSKTQEERDTLKFQVNALKMHITQMCGQISGMRAVMDSILKTTVEQALEKDMPDPLDQIEDILV